MKRVMHKLVMDYISLIIIFIVCIDEGDGHWKERDGENLRHDIELYKKMRDKIEREIDSFYDEYPEERLKVYNVDRIRPKDVTSVLHHKKETGKYNPSHKRNNQPLHVQSKNITNNIQSKYGAKEDDFKNKKSDKSLDFDTSWPKFEDFLSGMGKKYDWKNDRWIKVTGKLKVSSSQDKMKAKEANYNNFRFHEKHKFRYKIVKLNKSKSRRNVVVAVSAVR